MHIEKNCPKMRRVKINYPNVCQEFFERKNLSIYMKNADLRFKFHSKEVNLIYMAYVKCFCVLKVTILNFF